MKNFQLTYKPYGERSILIEWPSRIDETVLHDILDFKRYIIKEDVEQKININHAYNSLIISYKKYNINFTNEIQNLRYFYSARINHSFHSFKMWKIPVCYDVSFALDLESIAIEKGLTKDKIVQLHTEGIYTVYFIGFLPGFLYLGGLNNQLHVPRKTTPRLHIEKGAVAIGGNQTGVYPNQSPGGWNVIGNSPIDFFDVNASNPCFAKSGDKIQFESITLDEYQKIETLVNARSYKLEGEVLDG